MKNIKKWCVGIGALVLVIVVVVLFLIGQSDVEADVPGNVAQNEENRSNGTDVGQNGQGLQSESTQEPADYSVEVRNDILKSGEVVKLSNRTMEDYNDFVIPVMLKKAWKINESNRLESVPQEVYDVRYDSREELNPLVALPVYEMPGGGKVTYIQPQKVEFVQLTNSLDWVYVKAADGKCGWLGFEMKYSENGGKKHMIKGLDMDYETAFQLYYAKG